jgi:hypothetical protein
MISKRKLKWWCLTLVLAVMAAFLVSAQPLPAQAAADTETLGMFYDELAKYGTWVDYQKYGPVWFPTRVPEDWRPYVNGRWVPVQEGYVFETDEAWGWACYHYGNWTITEEYGWVWVPGSTWYPHTVAWRSPPEEGPGAVVAGGGAAAEAEAYVGWTPVPPEDWTPPPAYYPPACCPAGSPIIDIIAAPFWIFAQATSFLLGYGEPYAPGYSYDGCGCLAPVEMVPDILPDCPIIPLWGECGEAPGAFFGWGPDFGWAGGWGGVNINVNNVNINNFRNVCPPHHWQNQHKGAFPGAHPGQKPHHAGAGAHKPNNPHVAKAPKGTKPFSGHIPKAGSKDAPKGQAGKLGKSLKSTKGTHGKVKGTETGKHKGMETGKHKGVETGKHKGMETGKHKGVETGKHKGLDHGPKKGVAPAKPKSFSPGKSKSSTNVPKGHSSTGVPKGHSNISAPRGTTGSYKKH